MDNMIEKNLALLIDAENISHEYIDTIINEANKNGRVTYRRIYGDLSTPALNPWMGKLIPYSLMAVHQSHMSGSKNSSDFALVIDAMDIMYSNKVDGFCIATKDSDFTRLVMRIKEQNLAVIGMGTSKGSSNALVNACDKYYYLDKITMKTEHVKIDTEIKQESHEQESQDPTIIDNASGVDTHESNDISIQKITQDSSNDHNKLDTILFEEPTFPNLEKILATLRQQIAENCDSDGWALWSETYAMFSKKFPGFDPRNYGFVGKPLAFFEGTGKVRYKNKKSPTVAVQLVD